MKCLKNTIKLVVSLLISTSLVMAASQGTKGTESDGTSNINATISSSIIVDKLKDVNFGSFNPDNQPNDETMDFCVGMNSAKKLYTIKATAPYSSGNLFELTKDNGNPNKADQRIGYAVYLRDTSQQYRLLQPGKTEDKGGNGFSTQSDLTCPNTDQRLKVDLSDTSGKIAGQYSSILTLLVSPL